MTSDFTTKEKKEIIDKIREKINRASNILSGHLSKISQEENQENREHIRIIKREIRTILTQLAKLNMFCSKSVKELISHRSSMGVNFTMYQSISYFYSNSLFLDRWASSVLTLTTGLDDTKWPLELGVKLGIKFKDFLEANFTVKTKRPS